jgi:hypothetical protein
LVQAGPLVRLLGTGFGVEPGRFEHREPGFVRWTRAADCRRLFGSFPNQRMHERTAPFQKVRRLFSGMRTTAVPRLHGRPRGYSDGRTQVRPAIGGDRILWRQSEVAPSVTGCASCPSLSVPRDRDIGGLSSRPNDEDVNYRPDIWRMLSGSRAPCTGTFAVTSRISRRSPSVSSTSAAPRFSSKRASLVVPGMGTIQAF